VRVYPASILPDTPSGKLQTFKEIAQMPGLQQYIPFMLDGVPDLDFVMQRMKAPFEIAEKMVSHIIEDGEYEPPFPEMDLGAARDIATKELLRAKIENVPEERIDLLRRWIVDIDDMQAKAEESMKELQAPPEAPAGPPPGPPGGAGPQNQSQNVNVDMPPNPTAPYPL